MEKRPSDRRVIMTKRFLKSSLIDLLRKKTINEITIKEICSRADVNRTTFYNHYDSQYELYNDIITDVFEAVRQKQRCIYGDKTMTKSQATKKFFTTIFEFAEENNDLFLVILGNNGSISIGEAFSRYIDTFIYDEHPSQQLRYCLQFISAGFSNIMWLWLNEKEEHLPAEKIADVISSLLARYVK